MLPHFPSSHHPFLFCPGCANTLGVLTLWPRDPTPAAVRHPRDTAGMAQHVDTDGGITGEGGQGRWGGRNRGEQGNDGCDEGECTS